MKRSGVIPRRDLDWQAIAILFLAAMLLLFDLGGRSLWWDEIINVYIERQSIRGIFASLSGKPGFYQDIHPPLYHLMMHAWITLVSTSNLAMRLPSALFGLLSVALTYRVGHRLGGRSLARSAAYLMAMSAGGLMYLRMGRYYAMTCALGLLSTWLFLRVWTLPRLSNWLLYSAVALAMYYTDYLVVTVLATHTLYALWSGWKHRRAIVVRLAIMQVVVGLLFTPWLPSMFAQVGWAGKVAQADLAFSPAGYLMKIVFPFLSFTAGETLFPWEIPAIASYAAFGLMLILGITQNPLAREHFLLLLLLVSIPLLGTITVISILLPTIPFIGVPNRTLFALPYFSMLAASGCIALHARWRQIAALVAVTIAAVLGISNYFRGVHFFNPIYAVSAERLVDYIEQHSMPGDIVLSTEDIGFNYYANERSIETPRYLSYTPEADHAIEHAAAARIWWLTFGRDSTSALVNPATYRDQLARAGYVLESQQGFVPQDPTYQRVKEQLLNRDAYTHKVTISLYVPR